ncbi:hypothetical protein D3C80_715120 [compost metagenome]
MTVLTLVSSIVGEFGLQFLAYHGVAIGIEDVHVATGHLGHIPLFQEDEAAGHRQQGHLIGGDEVLADAATYHQGRAGAGHHHAAVVTAVHHHSAVGTAQLLHRDLHGRQQAGGGFQLVVNQVGDHLGVGVGTELVTHALQLAAQLFVVLYDAVVHYDYVLGDMGVRIALGGLAVGRPAGVGNAGAAMDGLLFQRLGQLGHLAEATHPLQRLVGAEHGHTGGVIAAVFQTAQAFYQDFSHITLGHCPDDATHRLLLKR